MKAYNIVKYLMVLSFMLSPTSSIAEDKIRVVTTIGQITDLVTNIGGDRVEVTGLMGPGVDPHLYKASESDVRKLFKADIIFYNGLHLEAKLSQILHKFKKQKMTVSLADSLQKSYLLDSEQYEGQYDPHIWFNVKLWSLTIDQVISTLSHFDPNYGDYYQQNGQAYKNQLNELHNYVEKRSSELEKNKRVLVTAHDAFRYFGQAYNFEVIGLQGISTESEAGARDVMRLADMIAENKIRAIFVESSIPERNIKAVQEAVMSRGWDVQIGGELFSDAMGTEGTPEGTYIGMVEHNINTIVDSLKDNQ